MSVDPRVCDACGHRDDRPRLAAGGRAALTCPACGAVRGFLRLPLLCLTGPSGAGKSTVAAAVAPRLAERLVTLEQDVLWAPELAQAPGGVLHFRRTWLRLAAMISQSGRPVLLCGTVAPPELEPLPERVLFRSVHYLALTAPAEVLVDRLRARPPWRGWDDARIAETVAFAAELGTASYWDGADVELLDTVTAGGVDDVAERVVAWADARLAERLC